MGERTYYDQHVVAKFKADSEAPSLQGHLRIGESAVDNGYDSKNVLVAQMWLFFILLKILDFQH